MIRGLTIVLATAVAACLPHENGDAHMGGFLGPSDPSPSLRGCAPEDARLRRAAARLIRWNVTRGVPIGDAMLLYAMRLEGVPYAWPRSWMITPTREFAETQARFDAWMATFPNAGERRCAVASDDYPDGTRAWVAVGADVLGDLAPLPQHIRSGDGVVVRATFHRRARSVSIVVAEEGDIPRERPVQTDGFTATYPVTCKRKGRCVIQVMADVGTGPRPILEAFVFVDVPVPDVPPVIRELDADLALSDSEQLRSWLNLLRRERGLQPLLADARLERAAREHTDHMVREQRLGHDLNRGDVMARAERLGIRARVIGENVAHADGLGALHRAWVESPSHLTNMLMREYDRVGIAVSRDGQGHVWATQIFAAGTHD
jgi:hypothetical protein